jgi:hypothetical protein
MHDEYFIPDLRQARLQARLVKLQRAVDVAAVGNEIGTSYPVQVDPMSIGELIEFDPYKPELYPRVGGIYVLHDICERPLYVGQAKSINSRLRNHHDKFWFKSPIVESGSYIRIDDKELRERVEAVLIRFMKSNAVINKWFVNR